MKMTKNQLMEFANDMSMCVDAEMKKQEIADEITRHMRHITFLVKSKEAEAEAERFLLQTLPYLARRRLGLELERKGSPEHYQTRPYLARRRKGLMMFRWRMLP